MVNDLQNNVYCIVTNEYINAYIYVYIQGVQDKCCILFFLFLTSVGSIDAHYASFEGLDPPSFIDVMTERMDGWNPTELWKRITCMMMIHAGHHNKEIMVPARCSLNSVK